LLSTSFVAVQPTNPYGELVAELKGMGLQANHLNQDAAFKSLIPQKKGVAVGMRGNAFTQIGTPHYEFHAELERFWASYRRGGVLEGLKPTSDGNSKGSEILRGRESLIIIVYVYDSRPLWLSGWSVYSANHGGQYVGSQITYCCKQCFLDKARELRFVQLKLRSVWNCYLSHLRSSKGNVI
jgi:hypothetical protein